MITILIAHIRGGLSFPGTENGKYREDDPRFLLLREGLRKMGMSLQADSLTPDGIDRTDDGKPYFKEIPGIRFNLSHSGDYIACAFSDLEIGLDLQICSAPHLSVMRIAKRFFTGQEYEALYTLPPAQDSPRPDNSAPRLDLLRQDPAKRRIDQRACRIRPYPGSARIYHGCLCRKDPGKSDDRNTYMINSKKREQMLSFFTVYKRYLHCMIRDT